jgi:hypothetical protein
MDSLDHLISEKERECSELEREIEELPQSKRLQVARIELRTLKLAAQARPAVGNGLDTSPRSIASEWPGAKKPWSLSAPYQRLVRAMIAKGNPPMNSFEIAALAKTVDFDLPAKKAGQRLRRYVSTGMAERADNGYRLTPAAVAAFGQGVAQAA